MQATQHHQKRRATLAQQSDRHELYQRSVQSPQHDAALLQRLYRQARGAPAHHLREDFCGSAATLRAWLAQGAAFTGEGYDIDADVLDWAARHNFRSPRVRRRVNLRAADARARSAVAPDIRCAFNFSYWIFRERAEMLDYFRTARDDLARDGVLALDVHGGGEAFSEEEQVTDFGDFEMVCHQTEVCPVDHSANLALHFRFPDGSQIQNAFRYRWRIWSLPEIADLLREAGFAEVRVHWCIEDARSARYELTEFGCNDPAWIACLTALK